ncbi:MAG: lipoprotein-releasing ABC transporter permease subunit [Cellvibrionaceae bacterium]
MMLSFFIGLRYTGAQRRNQLVSFISGISIFGMVISVALLVVVLSVMNGFDKELRERILTVMPQGAIYHRLGIDDWQALRERILDHSKETNNEIIEAAPFVQIAGMVMYKRQVSSMLLYGVDTEYQAKVSDLGKYLTGDLKTLLSNDEDANRGNKILLGGELAKKIGVEIDQNIRVVIPQEDLTNAKPKIKRFKVVGLIETGTEADQHLALTNIQAAQILSNQPESVSGIWLKLNDLFAAPHVVYETVMSLPRGYTSTDWTRSQGNIYQAIQMSKKLVGLLLILIIGIAAFNVVSTLIMVTVDKQGDIAILRTLGASTQKIMAIFMVQGTLIGVIGTTLGLLLGVLMASGVQEFVGWFESVIGFQFLKSDVYPISFIPEDIRSSDLIMIATIALTLSFFATIFPAWKASRVKPAEALRFEL